MPIELDVSNISAATLRVIGVGGAGGNAVRTMITRGLEHVEFVAANTDSQALMKNPAPVRLKLGHSTTRGLGAGANPDIGRIAVEESADEVRDALAGSDMVFITAGMGGGTGTGAAPIVASIAKELGALVVAIVTKPFSFENKMRTTVAERGIDELRNSVDALIVIPNDRIISIVDPSVPFKQAMEMADEVLFNATKGIADLIMNEGIINVDFADVVTVMRNQGDAMMGIGTGRGERRALEAAQNALNSPILEGMSIWGAKGLLVNVTGGPSLSLHEVKDAVSCVQKAAGDEAQLIHGVVTTDEDSDEISVTVVATGFTRQDGASAGSPVPTVVASPAQSSKPSITIAVTSATDTETQHDQVAPKQPVRLTPPANVDTSDIEQPAIWRTSDAAAKEKSARVYPHSATLHGTPATPTSDQDAQVSHKAVDVPAQSQTQQQSAMGQPEAFPRLRVKTAQSGKGSNQPSFLRKIMD